MSHSSLVIGIDLGTSNSALSFQTSQDQQVEVLAIDQITDVGVRQALPVLPSHLYIPHDGELTEGAVDLPWGSQKVGVVGTWARNRGVLAPERLVQSSKSWLCNRQVDREEDILPWKSNLLQGKVSPIKAASLFLEHLKQAFEHSQKQLLNSAEQVVITVPASFDEVARNLTLKAAEEVGIKQVTLLEEPQAALYAWLADHQANWREHLSPGDVVLVCDVGGGTSDFSLIAVSEKNEELHFERISVGDHLLLGGDNMDLALAYFLKRKAANAGHQLDRWQFLSLVGAARHAKESLFSQSELDQTTISVASRGSSLFAKTVQLSLSQEELSKVVLEGFFPLTSFEDFPQKRRTSGLQEYGLAYEQEPAVSKHLAAFLARSANNIAQDEALKTLVEHRIDANGCIMPNKILFNGGVFKAAELKKRTIDLFEKWFSYQPEVLQYENLDLAVAKGAVQFGRTKVSGQGIRIRSGLSRSYYLGLEESMMAIPGVEPEIKGLCIAPQGLEEGSHVTVPNQQFGLVIGSTVEFRLFNANDRASDLIGDVVDDAPGQLEETAKLSLTLPSENIDGGDMVPVNLEASVTEIGTLKLIMKHLGSQKTWDLEFNVRADH